MVKIKDQYNNVNCLVFEAESGRWGLQVTVLPTRASEFFYYDTRQQAIDAMDKRLAKHAVR